MPGVAGLYLAAFSYLVQIFEWFSPNAQQPSLATVSSCFSHNAYLCQSPIKSDLRLQRFPSIHGGYTLLDETSGVHCSFNL